LSLPQRSTCRKSPSCRPGRSPSLSGRRPASRHPWLSRADLPPRGPVGDHTLRAMVNDPHVFERRARPQTGHSLVAPCGNVLPQFSGGQVVAGSNPVNPTRSRMFGSRWVDHTVPLRLTESRRHVECPTHVSPGRGSWCCSPPVCAVMSSRAEVGAAIRMHGGGLSAHCGLVEHIQLV
jgi:hypothetical protein